MANEEHLAKLKEGVEAWNAWRRENGDVTPDLSLGHLVGANLNVANLFGTNLIGANLSWANLFGANLSGANLSGADLSLTDLTWADLSRTTLSRADLSMATLRGANLSRAILSQADLSWAILSGAILSEADLSKAILSGANLSMAILSGAQLARTHIADVDLSDCKGLEAVTHLAPSFLEIGTIYKSGGHIPDVFLRGCGVPADLIDYVHSIAGAIQFYSCFISYSTKDQEFAERLHSDLQAKGLRIWFAPEDIKGGRKVHEQVSEAIRLYDKLLVVLSPHSMESEWVKYELHHALQEELRNNKRKLFPIRLVPFEDTRRWSAFDADLGKDMAREVREYSIPDFSNWKDHDAYQKAFDRLLQDLRASEGEKGAE